MSMLYALILSLFIAVSPFLCLLIPSGRGSAQTEPATPSPVPFAVQATSSPEETDAQATAEPDSPQDDALTEQAQSDIVLYDAAIGGERTVSVHDFLVGSVACEVPPSWEDDAIKAQMVASHSYALYQQNSGSNFSVNSDLCAGWTTAEVLQAKWGSSYEEYYSRFSELADAVEEQLLVYDNAPAAACYHAISSGHTEASQNVWGSSLPYLQGVDSAWDRQVENFEVTIEYSASQMSAMLATILSEAPDEADAANWLGQSAWDDSGYVSSIEICGETVSGVDVRDVLNLRSACFAMAWRDDLFVITTRGFGHGVGLSQEGAQAMAKGGSTWQEILLYYFPGCEVKAGKK